MSYELKAMSETFFQLIARSSLLLIISWKKNRILSHCLTDGLYSTYPTKLTHRTPVKPSTRARVA
jgi:hypothetical protein